MKIAVSRAAFLRELQLLTAVVDRKTTIPIIQGVKITTTSSGEIACVATDLEIALDAHLCSQAVANSGSTVVPLETLLGLVQRFPDGDLALESINELAVTLSVAGTSVKVPTFPVEDFPTVPTPTDATATIKAAYLIDLIERARFAMGSSAYYPSGAFCVIEANQIRLSATDAHQIVTAVHDATASADAAFGLTDKAWDVLAKLLREDEDAPVSFAASENHVWWSTAGHTLSCRLIDRTFPKYERIIPTVLAFTVTLDAGALRDVLRRQLVLATMGSCKVTLQFADGRLGITSKTERGEARDAIDVEGSTDYEKAFALNPKYALSAVEALRSERVRLSLAKDGRAVVWHAADAPDQMTATSSVMSL